MTRPAQTTSSPYLRLTILSVVAVVLAFLVLALAPVKPPVTPDELSGAINHLSEVAEGAAVVPAVHPASNR